MAKTQEIFVKRMKKLVGLCSQKCIKGWEGYTSDPATGFSMHKNKGYSKELEELVEEIIEKKSNLKKLAGREYLENYLRDVLDKYVIEIFKEKSKNRPKKISEKYKELAEALRRKYRYYIPIPISNLETGKSIKVGKVTFVPYKRKSYIKNFEKRQNKEKDKIRSNYWDRLAKDFEETKCKCYGYVEVEALDEAFGFDVASDLISEATNILKIHYPKYRFGIPGIHYSPMRKEHVILNMVENSALQSGEWVGMSVPLYLKSKELDELKNIKSFKNINKILRLSSEKRTGMQQKLVRTTSWTAEILDHKKDAENIARIITAMESLVLLHKHEVKKKNVSERVPLIVTKAPNERIKIKKLIEKMYEIRNQWVHEGHGSVDFKDHENLSYILRILVITVAIYIDKYPKADDWINQVEKAKMSTSLEFQKDWN